MGKNVPYKTNKIQKHRLSELLSQYPNCTRVTKTPPPSSRRRPRCCNGNPTCARPMQNQNQIKTAWASDWRGHVVTYSVFVSSTAAWLYAWTSPLLGSNPVTWIILYALGSRDPSGKNTAEFSTNEGQASSETWAGILPHAAVTFSRRVWSELCFTGAAVFGGGFEQGMGVNRPLLAAGWVLVLAVVVPCTPWLVKRLSLRKTTARKVFHALVTAMFVPAIALEVRAAALVR